MKLLLHSAAVVVAEISTSHLDTKLKITQDGSDAIEIEMECPKDKWCGFAFDNDHMMPEADMVTFGHHACCDKDTEVQDMVIRTAEATLSAAPTDSQKCQARSTLSAAMNVPMGDVTVKVCGTSASVEVACFGEKCGAGCGAGSGRRLETGCGTCEKLPVHKSCTQLQCEMSEAAAKSHLVSSLGCSACSGQCSGCSACGAGCSGSAACSGSGRRLRGKDYTPKSYGVEFVVPPLQVMAEPVDVMDHGGVVGVALNSVLFVHSHPGETALTWEFDGCGGHGEDNGRYHYHLPPLCLLQKLGATVALRSDWWVDEKKAVDSWPSKGVSVQVGVALDGTPIYGPYDENGDVLVSPTIRDDRLDRCHGRMVDGEYRYHITVTAPFLPPCFTRAPGRVVQGSSEEACVRGGSRSALLAGNASVLVGSGCPDHEYFQDVVTRRLHSGGCQADAACGGCSGGSCGANRFAMWKKNGWTHDVCGTLVSITQCDGLNHNINVDQIQNLYNRTYEVADGKMRSTVKRRLSTCDPTDKVLDVSHVYHMMLVEGSGLSVGYHGQSSAQVKKFCASIAGGIVDCPEAASCGAAVCGASSCGSSSCGASSCGASSCGASCGGAATCGASSCGAATCGASTCGAATCGASTCGAATRGASSCGAST